MRDATVLEEDTNHSRGTYALYQVLSPEDTFSRTQVKCRDYLAMGVPEVWIFDPEERTAFVVTEGKTTEQREGNLLLKGTEVVVDLVALFAVLDEG